jgi:tetratricopeptide (TPR) repeat protein
MKYRLLLVSFLLAVTSSSFAQPAKELFEEGLQLRKDGKVKEAIERFKRAVALKPGYTEALYEMGWCQNDTKDYTGAIQSLRKVRQEWSDVAKVHFELGYAFEKSSLNDSALASYKRCLAINNQYSLAWKQLGYMAYLKDDAMEALEYFTKYEAAAKSPIIDYLYWYRKGFCYNVNKEYNNAKTALFKSLEYKKDYFNTYLELGFACSRLKEDEMAVNYYKRAIEIDPGSHVPYNGIGEVYRDNKKDFAEAMVWYQKTLALNANERKGNFGMGYCLNATGKNEEAISYLKRAIENEKDYVAAFVELGYSYHKTGRNSEALTSLKKAISLNPKNENARYYATLVYISINDKSNAQRMVDELKALSSRHTTGLQEKVNKM